MIELVIEASRGMSGGSTGGNEGDAATRILPTTISANREEHRRIA
jgi:hypothetical protein